MPYSSTTELPAHVRDQLTSDEQQQWLAVFNQVFAQTQDDGKAAAAAWGAINKARGKARRAVKSRMTDDGKVIVEGWAMLFTDSERTDEHDEYFDRATKLLLNYYQGAPLWMEHGLDERYGPDPIGRRHSAEIYGYGIWLAHELHPEHPLFPETKERADRGEFSYSSDSIRHYVQQGYEYDGRLGVWPFAGCSLTTDPAEPGLGPVSIKAFKSAMAKHLEQLPPSEAREAQRPRGSLLSEASKGVTMTPEMLAALAEFLGVEATPEAVSAALQELISQLNGVGETPTAEEAAMMADTAAALSLPATVGKAEVVAKLNDIAKMLAEPVPAGRSLNFDALKRFHGLVEEALEEPDEEQDEPPFQTRSNRRPNDARRPSAPYINGRAKKPGIVQMLRDIHPQIPSSLKSAKAQSYQIGPTGGYVLNHEVVSEFLPALRNALPLYDMGVQQYDMDGVESLTIPKDKDEHEAYWVGENTDIPESEEKVGGLVLYPRPIAARVHVPNKFLTNSTIDYEARVREKIEFRISHAIMRAALYGTGGTSSPNVGAQPLGLATLAGMAGRSVTKTTLGTGNGAKPKLTDLTAAIGRIEDANVELDETTKFLFAPRTKRFFADMTDANGQPLLRGSWADKEERDLAGYGWETTNLISITETVGSSNDCTTIFTGVWRHMALGLSNQFEFLIDPYSESRKLMTVIIAYTYADLAVLYDEAFEIITGVRA